MRISLRALLAGWAVVLIAPASAFAQDLRQRIDERIAAAYPNYDKCAAPVASDAEFLRRATLDLNGTIPRAADTRAFLADSSSDKRAKLVDKLIAGPAFARRMEQFFDVMLMERRRDGKVPRAVWEEYLRTSFERNKPYDQLVKEILSADGADPKARGPAKFYLDRDLEPNVVTRDIGRLFLGRNMQCAQCHDSPIVADYKQEHYFGILAYLNRSFLFPNAQVPTAVIGEKAEGEVSFMSVFDKSKAQKATGPKMLNSKAVPEPKFEKGKEYKVAPAANVKPVPNFSRRAQLAGDIIATESFRRNAANRLWAMMMGRGLVQPLEFDHSSNPASHPELLKLLADEFAAHKFDVKWFVRELALSKIYQRSSAAPANLKEAPPDRYLTGILKPLAPEQFAYAMMQATGLTDSERQALGKNDTDAALSAKLAPRAQPFVQMFGSQPGQPEDNFVATLDQTLFLKHGNLVRGFIVVRPGNLLDRIGKLADATAIADELFLSIFTRPATDEEKKDVAELLKDAKDRNGLLSEAIWAMLASEEFRFNH
jgi:hypothetical protein